MINRLLGFHSLFEHLFLGKSGGYHEMCDGQPSRLGTIILDLPCQLLACWVIRKTKNGTLLGTHHPGLDWGALWLCGWAHTVGPVQPGSIAMTTTQVEAKLIMLNRFTSKNGQNSFCNYATTMWNDFPSPIKESASLLSFKTALKEFFRVLSIHWMLYISD